MREKRVKTQGALYVFAVLCIAMLLVPAGAAASDWWDVTPEEEIPAELYDSVLYSEIPSILHEAETNSDRVKVEVIGQSAGGRNLFLATIASGGARDRLKYFRFYRMMSRDPEKAFQMLDNSEDIKVPVFINGSIHGNEYPGTDACIRLINTLAYEDNEEIRSILDNMIVLINVCQNPDGRVLGTRQNANRIDLNRDFITQSQPETRITASLVAKWNPLIFLDLHDDIEPMLIEPCSPPHNQNYEYDLYIKWAFYQAEAMEAELMAQTGLEAQIPYRDWEIGWDDWPPIYGAMYPMYHGAYGHTLETPYEDEIGVDAHYAAVWGALKFVAENKRVMLEDQLSIFWRGIYEQPQQQISEEMLAESEYDQFNEFTTKEFPAAFVIPADGATQLSSHQPAKLVDFMIFNGIEVETATQPFTLDGVEYPEGTYVVWTDQPKRGLATTILESGADVSDLQEGMEFYSPPTAWSHPLLWGVHRVVMEEKADIQTAAIKKAAPPEGSLEAGEAGAYAYEPINLQAIKVTNMLLDRGVSLYRSEAPFTDSEREFGAGIFMIPGDSALADELANEYALDVLVLSSIPEQAVPMKKQRIAVDVYGPNGLPFVLTDLGFDADIVSEEDLNSGVLSEYDVFISDGGWPFLMLAENSLEDLKEAGLPEDIVTALEAVANQNYKAEGEFTDALKETIGEENTETYKSLILEYTANGNDENLRGYIAAFFQNGGDYIGMGDGVSLAQDAGFADFSYDAVDADAIAHIDYVSTDPVAAGFSDDGYALVIEPVYFTNVPEDFKVAASIDNGDFLVAGYWSGWQESEAKGMPVIIHKTEGTQDVTLIGIQPTFRAHPRNTFRIMANAIYNALD
ncbi:M14 family zinc carboxypeptidase [Desulfococcaceae bacterium HSG8]|nr:M14 family zinc carboxypeptidase [Desulfococcaceae bacterium HSG8]